MVSKKKEVNSKEGVWIFGIVTAIALFFLAIQKFYNGSEKFAYFLGFLGILFVISSKPQRNQLAWSFSKILGITISVWGLYLLYTGSYRYGGALIFFGFLTWYIHSHTKGRDLKAWDRFPFLYLVMYRTTWGLEGMDRIAKFFPRLMSVLAYIGIIVGFLGMLFIAVMFVVTLIPLFIEPDAPANAGLVLPVEPNDTFEGIVFFVPFEMWILSIIILAFVHEYAHGIIARLYNIKVKSSGYVFMGIAVPIIPAAFVEPDEKKLAKRPLKQQLGVFAAGPFSNVLLAFLVALPLSLGVGAFTSSLLDFDGIEIVRFDNETSPALDAGMGLHELIIGFDDVDVSSVAKFNSVLQNKKPGDSLLVKTNVSSYQLTLAQHPSVEDRGYMGITSQAKVSLTTQAQERYPSWFLGFLLWLKQFLGFLFMLNIGIGLFNLAPVGPLDGGHMLHATLLHYFEKKKAMKYFVNISLFFFIIIIMNLLIPLVKAFFS